MEIRKTFLKKYQFVFDGSKKLAGYYDMNIKVKSNDNTKKTFSLNKKKIIIICLILNIILIPLFYYLAKRLYIRRKLNAKELKNFYEDINNQKTSLNIERNFSK